MKKAQPKTKVAATKKTTKVVTKAATKAVAPKASKEVVVAPKTNNIVANILSKPGTVVPKTRRKTIKIEHYDPPKVTFLDKAIKGEVVSGGFVGVDKVVDKAKVELFNKQLDQHIDAWHADPKSTNLLHEYLGLTAVEYKKLLSDATYIEDLVEDRNKKAAKASKKKTK